MTASSKTMSAAATFSWICFGLVAPTIAEAIFGFFRIHAIASWPKVMESSSAIGFRFWTAFNTSSCIHLATIWEPDGSVALDPAGTGCPGRYLPVSTPWAIGDQTICEMPFAWEVGITSGSMTLQSIEYWGWFETMRSKFISLAISTAAWICSAFHSETPI